MGEAVAVGTALRGTVGAEARPAALGGVSTDLRVGQCCSGESSSGARSRSSSEHAESSKNRSGGMSRGHEASSGSSTAEPQNRTEIVDGSSGRTSSGFGNIGNN